MLAGKTSYNLTALQVLTNGCRITLNFRNAYKTMFHHYPCWFQGFSSHILKKKPTQKQKQKKETNKQTTEFVINFFPHILRLNLSSFASVRKSVYRSETLQANFRNRA